MSEEHEGEYSEGEERRDQKVRILMVLDNGGGACKIETEDQQSGDKKEAE